MKNLTCFLFYHKISKLTDSGYGICDRCKSHEYYDSPGDFTNVGWFYRPFWWIHWKIFDIKQWLNYKSNRKIKPF
jgi:hypothetical protein